MRDIVSKGLIVALLAAGSALAANGPEKLLASDQKLLAATVAKKQETVSVLILTQPGLVAAVAGYILELGGMMRYHDDQLGYLRVRISSEKVREVAAFVNPPGPGTPAESAYMPTRILGAAVCSRASRTGGR